MGIRFFAFGGILAAAFEETFTAKEAFSGALSLGILN
jgi:hypothetical protein